MTEMQLRFRNSYRSPLSAALMWYSPFTCGGEGDWETRGWWNLNPGDSVTTNVGTLNRYFAIYAEAWDGAIWAGQYVANVSIFAFDGCSGIGTSVSDANPDPYFDVGFRLIDAGFWFWTYATYTVNLT